MITDGYWKLELWHNKQRIIIWSFINRFVRSRFSEHCVSREFLYSATVIRKICDDDKEARALFRQSQQPEPSLEVLKYRVPMRKIPFIGDKDFIFHRIDAEDYDYSSATEIKYDLAVLCSKIIHSYVWSCVYKDKWIYAIAFASDTDKEKEIFLLKVEDWIKTIEHCLTYATI